jgi:farnesyl diphosphate synthase
MPISRQEFEAIFPKLVDDITSHSSSYGLPEQALTWFRNVETLAYYQHTH